MLPSCFRCALVSLEILGRRAKTAPCHDLVMSLSRVCTRVVQGFVQGLKCRKRLILLACQGVKGPRGGEGGMPLQAAKRSPSEPLHTSAMPLRRFGELS